MSEVQNIARDVQAALPNADQTQIFHAEGSSVIITDHEIFEIYEDGENVFVQVAKRGAFEAVGDDTMWWATVSGEANPHFTDEALEPYRIGDEAEYQPWTAGYAFSLNPDEIKGMKTSPIEITGDEFSARWGSATNEQIDKITAFAESILGKPDTTT